MTRTNIPPRPSRPILTDSGLETWLIFERGIDLPEFAAFPLLETSEGRDLLTEYWELNLGVATARGLDFILGAPTWRASAVWGARLGYDAAALDRINRDGIAFMQDLRDRHQGPSSVMPVWGSVGPKSDAYKPDQQTGPAEAEAYHRPQIDSFKAAGADAFTAQTLTHSDEAIGIALAARAAGLPCTLSFTTETDGRLPSGEGLGAAIQRVDDATHASPASYMINCAHPDHFRDALATDAPGSGRRPAVPDIKVMELPACIFGAAYFAAYKADQNRTSIAGLSSCVPGSSRGANTSEPTVINK